MKITVKQLRALIKEEVQNSLKETTQPNEPKFIARFLRSSGSKLMADEQCVLWPDGALLQPDEIQSINYKGKSLPVDRRDKKSIPGYTVHKLYFTTPEGKIIEYTYYVNKHDDKEEVQASLGIDSLAQDTPTGAKKKVPGAKESWVMYIFDVDENYISRKANYATRELAVEARNKLFIEQLLSNEGYYDYDPDSKDPKIQQEIFQDYLKQENAKTDDDMFTDGHQEFWVQDTKSYKEFARSLNDDY